MAPATIPLLALWFPLLAQPAEPTAAPEAPPAETVGPPTGQAPSEAGAPAAGPPSITPPAPPPTAPGPAVTAAAAPSPPPAGPSPFWIDTMVQLRYEETRVTIAAGTTALLSQQFAGDMALVADGQRLIEDSARQTDGLWLRRAFLHAGVNASPTMKGEVLLDLARLLYDAGDPRQMVRFAYGQYAPVSRVALNVGVLLLEDDYVPEFAEKGATHALLEHMRFVGPEVGLLLDVAPLRQRKWLRIEAAALDAGAAGGQSFRGPGLLVFRATTIPVEHLALGADVSWRPRALTAWWEELRFHYQEYDAGSAISARAALTFPRFMVGAEAAGGDRTDNDVSVPLKQRRGDARTWRSMYGMAAVRIPIAGKLVTPAVRAEWLDTDREHPGVGEILEVTGAVGVELTERVRLLLDVTRHYVQFGTRNWRYDLARYDADLLTGTAQLQLQM